MAGWVELLWSGKREKDFTRESVDNYYGPIRQARRIALPFQKIELLGINKQTQEPLFPQAEWPQNYPQDWKNLLIWGDNLIAMSSLLNGIDINGTQFDLRGKIKLIYIDPPFATGADFSFKVPMPESWRDLMPKSEIVKNPSIVEELAYRDMWGGRTPEERISSYLNYMYDRLVLMKELLADDGSIYVHLDHRMVHYIKLIMDEVFGKENFRNEIIWHYGGRGAKAIAKQFPRNHDVILFYTKTENYSFTPIKTSTKLTYQEARSLGYRKDDSGRWFKTAPRGDYTDSSIKQLEEEGRIFKTRSGNIRIKYFLDEEDGYVINKQIVGDVWNDIPDMMHAHREERLNYPTQKREPILERILLASSNEGDIVADFFCGSGTLAAVAEKLGRRWICTDMSKYAVHVTRKRLLDIKNSKALGPHYQDEDKRPTYGKPSRPFYLATIANYLIKQLTSHSEVIPFVLKLYGAAPMKLPLYHLHGLREPEKEIVHVGQINFPVTPGEIQESIEEFKETAFFKNEWTLVILGWDWAPDTFERAKDFWEQQGIKLKLLHIPPVSAIEEVLKKHKIKAADVIHHALPDDIRKHIRFVEPGYLRLKVRKSGLRVTLTIEDFWVRLPHGYEALEEEIRKRIEKASLEKEKQRYFLPLINYWAVDWNYDGSVFKHDFVSFDRKAGKGEVDTSASHSYSEPSTYRVVVKVTDIFGGETSRELKLKVGE